ncbi:unnamed protein product [Acanthoscelides obtectus]|uniref:Uncharacterized protein n=1 Tax=Acanthoscelides obtectus TaxID=200917 RepID=A0A9P0KSP7_ACAOB|nr:unnamed protein product [Acanthoscelides obtectus]CAK1657768.1 hypothetical protein AOBTE_LOCUS20525 [Acanthoscelides obtectus]
MTISAEAQVRYLVQWFQEWSELQRSDFLPIMAEKYANRAYVNGIINSIANVECREKPMSLFECRISDQHLFESPAKYLILVDAGSHDKLLKMMERLEILPMSEIVIATFLSDSLAHLYKPYKISKDTSLSK